ncbi:hypothetical protein MMC25_007369 [Agyrium rufum]|nr:hypothetical protein [Agyrium rufum]
MEAYDETYQAFQPEFTALDEANANSEFAQLNDHASQASHSNFPSPSPEDHDARVNHKQVKDNNVQPSYVLNIAGMDEQLLPPLVRNDPIMVNHWVSVIEYMKLLHEVE